MKIIVIGTTGTIGVEVAKALSAGKHEVVGASRNGEFKVNLEDSASIHAMFDKIPGVDAVIRSSLGRCCEGAYVAAVEGSHQRVILDPRQLGK